MHLIANEIRDSDERRRYNGVFKARSKAELEQYYNNRADETGQ